MNKSISFSLLVALISILFWESNLFSVTPYAMVTKSIWYSQTNASDLIIDPQSPYEFSASVSYDSSVSNIVSASLSGPCGLIPLSKAVSFGNNTKGVGFDEYFKDKSSLDSNYNGGSNKYIFTVNFSNKTDYFTNQFNSEVYAPLPIITATNNCNWSPSGYIMAVDSSRQFTISWPGGASVSNMSTILSIYGIGDFSGLVTNFSSTPQFTFSTNLISQLPKGIVIPVHLLNWINPSSDPWGNAYNTYNRFSIFIPPSLVGEGPLTAVKKNTLTQTNNNNPVDFVPIIGPDGFYSGWDYGPYNFSVSSPLPCTFRNPSRTLFTTSYTSDSGYHYGYSSGAMTKDQMDTLFPNGVYGFSTGQMLNLSGDSYPSAPKVLRVNGGIPSWTNGMLLLDSTKNNTIAWSAYSNSSTAFARGGIEFVDLGSTDYSDLSGNFGSVTNVVLCPIAGMGTLSQTNLVLPNTSVRL